VQIYPHPRDILGYDGRYLPADVDLKKTSPHLYLLPYCSTEAFDVLRTQFGGELSRFVGFFERSTVVSLIHKCQAIQSNIISHFFSKNFLQIKHLFTFSAEWPIFDYFNCLDRQIYYWIIISLISIGLLFSLKSRSLWAFWSTFWEFGTIILSDCYAHQIRGNLYRIISGIWLMSCVLLLSISSGGLWDFLIRLQPTDKIDSWDDL